MEHYGTLDGLRVLKVLGCVNSAPDFIDQHLVINGASDLFTKFSEKRKTDITPGRRWDLYLCPQAPRLRSRQSSKSRVDARRALLKIPVVFVSILCVHLQAAEPVDAKAQGIAQAMMKEMGGQDAWNQAHFVRYDFRVSAGGKTVADRSHLWDKRTGRYRLETVDKNGARQVVLFNTADAQSPAKPEVKQAYATFINDMYWLAMPWKWMDAGVHLKYLGNKADSTWCSSRLTM